MNRFFFVSILFGCAGVAGATECDSLESMKWLLGDWRAEDVKATWRETWTEVSPKTWEGRGIEVSRADPARQSAEELRLVEMGGGVYYLAKVGHNELPIPFRLVECGEGRLVFANPAHDFPRRLVYERQPDGRLQVRVSEGGDEGFTLDFAHQPANCVDSAAVLADEDARFSAMVAADTGALGRLLAEDLSYVHSTGRVVDRKQMIDEIQAGKLRYRAVAPSERHVTLVEPDAAFVRGLARIEVSADAKPVEFQARYLAIYVRDAGAWKLRAWQSLRLP